MISGQAVVLVCALTGPLGFCFLVNVTRHACCHASQDLDVELAARFGWSLARFCRDWAQYKTRGMFFT
jgi:hypothetical protein